MAKKNAVPEPAPLPGGELGKYKKYAPLLLFAFFCLFYFPLLSGSNYLWEDVLEQHYPNAVYTARALSQGALPQWTPYIFGGMPYQADMQTGLFYPPNWVLFGLSRLFEPGGTAFIWFILLHVLLFGFGAYFLARSFLMSEGAALLTAVICMFSGFVSTHVIHIVFLYVSAWLPFAFLFLKKSYESGSLRFLALGALFFGVSILGGYAQYTLFGGCLLLAYTLLVAFENRSKGWRGLLGYFAFFGLFMAIAAGLALVQLLPTMELSAESVRSNMTWDESSAGSLGFQGLITFLAPKFFGWVTGIMSQSPVSGEFLNGSPYWGGAGQHLFWETAIFIGVLPLLLFAAGFRYLKKEKKFVFFSLMALLSLLLALGSNGPLYYWVFQYVPGFGSFRHPGRFAFLFTFSFAFAVGLALDRLTEESRKFGEYGPKMDLKPLAITAGVFALALFVSFTWLSGVAPVKAACARKAVGFGLFILVASVGLIAYLTRAGQKEYAALTLVIFVFFELYLFGHVFGNGRVSGPMAYPKSDTIEKIKADLAQTHSRFQGRIFEGEGKGVRIFPHLNWGNVYAFPVVEGYNQLHLLRLSRFVHEVAPDKGMSLFSARFRANPDNSGFYIAPDSATCPRFSLRSRVFTVPDGDAAIRAINSPSFNPLRDAVVESRPTLLLNPALSPDSLGSVRVVSFKPERIELAILANDNSLLFASEVFYPAWHALLDGKEVPIFRTNYLFRGVDIPKGGHTLVFEYRSKALVTGAKASAGALVVVLLLIFLWPRLPAGVTGRFAYMQKN
ncbi:MAG: YfhO family protein [Fibrobacterota bacterium]